MTEYEIIKYLPSEIAIAAIFLAIEVIERDRQRDQQRDRQRDRQRVRRKGRWKGRRRRR